MKEMMEIWRVFIKDSNAVIALFTAVLVVTTIVYTVVTYRLLKQSRNALLADMVLRLVELLWSSAERALKEEFGQRKDIDWFLHTADAMVRSCSEGVGKAFLKIDKKLGKDFQETFAVWDKEASRILNEQFQKMGEKPDRGEEDGNA